MLSALCCNAFSPNDKSCTLLSTRAAEDESTRELGGTGGFPAFGTECDGDVGPDRLCCIATEKIWWLLTKFIINNHLTVEEKICHRK
ncbi:hypothetical protein [Wolbachia endosymbiont (group A) of Bibio marci]|uniref:hypothetical protein n=1 Tax=Wolbachia endosymbiont (group A) of Bibio marci TaxID=2953987 RepID=UPI002231C9C7|nr:hypothetical protein [Wolbachia endosymbiont (group A) of Bibio marci]